MAEGQWSWGITMVQRTVMEGVKAGASIGARDDAVRDAAPGAAELMEAFPGSASEHAENTAQALAERMRACIPARFAADLAPTLRASVEAALVLGARVVAEADGGAVDVDALQDLAADEIWLYPQTVRLLREVVCAIVVVRCPLPGATRFLDQARPPAPPEIHEVRSAEGSRLEVRTDWIRDPDTATEYQWCVRRDGDRLSLSNRRRGRKQFDTDVEIPIRDVDTLVRLLERTSPDRIRAGAVSDSHPAERAF